ncbi:LppX_LprAFG lipoprotein [Actinomadura miaoliensis]|uniref:LppX_LprAFG lipoprotein n=1 Tax=Actinomadura miaoliensis TaxID=430685 RepID=A0ABP7W6W2_9ACTN
MRLLTTALAVSAVVGMAAACSGGEEPKKNGGSRASQAALPAPVPAASLRPVALPDQPGPLIDTIARQVRTAGTVRTDVVSSGEEGGGARQQEKISAQVRIGARPPQAQMTIVDQDPADPSTTEAVVTGGIVYTRVDGQEQAPGKPWVRLSRQDLRNPELGPFAKILTGILDSVDTGLAQISVDSGLQVVRAGRFDKAAVTETVDGVRTRRYSGRTPTAELAKTDTAYKAIAQLGGDEVPWTLWVDDKGLPRRFRVDIRTERGLGATQDVRYRQWGEPVSIQAPPAAQVHTIGS